MKTLLFSAFILITAIGMAQITITQSDFAVGGDTARVSFSDDQSLDIVTTGADIIWDYSSINITTQTIDTFFDINDAPFLYQVIFNNGFTDPEHESDWYRPWSGAGLANAGTFGVDIGAPVQFTAVRSDKVENTGVGFEIFGQEIPGPSDTVDVQYELPMNYLDSWTSNSYTNIDLNPAFDAIYRRYQYRTSVVDGWGEIITPWGTFDAIRVRSEISSSDSLYIGQFSFWAELPVPDQVEYHWFTNGQKMPIFSVTTADVGGNETITEVKFKDKKRDFASDEELMDPEVALFPNPVADILTIQLTAEAGELNVFDLSGKLVYTELPSANQVFIDVQSWQPGIYILEVTHSSGISSFKVCVK